MTLTYKLDIVRIKVNHGAKCLVKDHSVRKFSPNTHRHTRQTD